MAKVRASGPDKNPTPNPISSSEIHKIMHAERGLIDIKEVCKNIESVRTSWVEETKGRVTGDAYGDLISRLHVGFTKAQLVAYLGRNGKKAKKKAGKKPAADDFDLSVEFSSTLYTRSTWQPSGNKPLQKARAPKIGEKPPTKGSQQKAQKNGGQDLSKHTLVKRIIRQCWDIKPEFQASTIGELDMRLPQIHISLIINHSKCLESQ